MLMRRIVRVVPALVVVAGCADYSTASRYDRGLVLILPGIEGRGVFNQQIVDGLGRAGVPYALEVYDWTSGLSIGFLAHLMDYERNRGEAQRIAWRLVCYRRSFPGRPIWLVGQSGGGGLLVLALERVPDDLQVNGAVLLAPALSQEYNLGPALRHCAGLMYHYYSPNDALFLGMGTGVFGTIDRKYESAAGRKGFHKSLRIEAQDARLYDQRLRQIDCSQPGNAPGHAGLHLTSSSPEFVEKVVAPLIWRGPAGRPGDVPSRAPTRGRYPTVPGAGCGAAAPAGGTRAGSTPPTPGPVPWRAPSQVGTPPTAR